jgi:diguanylate cyclase (GGDEF)-like protein
MRPDNDPITLHLNWIEQDGILHGYYATNGVDSHVEIHIDPSTSMYSAIMCFPSENNPLQLEPARNLEQFKDSVREYLLYDPLTSLYSRRVLLWAMLNEIKTNAQPFSVIYSDIDYLRQFNGAFGHEQGDLAIVTIASLIKNCVGSKGWVGRYGGDEFLVVLPDTSLEEAQELEEKMRREVQAYPFPYEAPKNQLGISSGVACSLELESTEANNSERLLENLLQLAELGLHRAKCSRNIAS